MTYLKKINDLLIEGYTLSASLTKVFGILGIINYPVFFFLFDNHNIGPNPDFILRIIASLLCIVLLFLDKVPEQYKKYNYLYWIFTVTFCLPFLVTFLFLYHQGSPEWSINIFFALFWLILVVDSMTFAIILPTGIMLGYITFLTFYKLPESFHIDDLSSLVINFGWVVITASVFSRKREVIVQRQKLDELAALNKELKDNKTELEKALAAKTEFLNNMSHEIRTPIQGFLSFSEGLQTNWTLYSDTQKQYYTSLIVTNAGRLSSLVGALLDLTKFDNGKIHLEFKKFNIIDSIHDMIEEANILYFKEKNIKFTFVPTKTKLLIAADKERISQVLRNIFYNALKYSSVGSNIDISLIDLKEASDKTSSIHIIVKDNGIGIPENELEAIFDPFTQSSLSKTKAGGTGLGLAICKKIIEAHQGKIWAENNTKSLGASFHIILPKAHHQSVSVQESTTDEVSEIQQEHNESKTIMIIDDEEIILTATEMILLNNNYKIMKALGGKEGLEIIKENYHNIDLILLDLMMPDMYGLNVLKRLKDDENTKNIPVIIQSGASDEKERERCLASGAVFLLTKPYNRRQLITAINTFIN